MHVTRHTHGKMRNAKNEIQKKRRRKKNHFLLGGCTVSARSNIYLCECMMDVSDRELLFVRRQIQHTTIVSVVVVVVVVVRYWPPPVVWVKLTNSFFLSFSFALVQYLLALRAQRHYQFFTYFFFLCCIKWVYFRERMRTHAIAHAKHTNILRLSFFFLELFVSFLTQKKMKKKKQIHSHQEFKKQRRREREKETLMQ